MFVYSVTSPQVTGRVSSNNVDGSPQETLGVSLINGNSILKQRPSPQTTFLPARANCREIVKRWGGSGKGEAQSSPQTTLAGDG